MVYTGCGHRRRKRFSVARGHGDERASWCIYCTCVTCEHTFAYERKRGGCKNVYYLQVRDRFAGRCATARVSRENEKKKTTTVKRVYTYKSAIVRAPPRTGAGPRTCRSHLRPPRTCTTTTTRNLTSESTRPNDMHVLCEAAGPRTSPVRRADAIVRRFSSYDVSNRYGVIVL